MALCMLLKSIVFAADGSGCRSLKAQVSVSYYFFFDPGGGGCVSRTVNRL